MKYLPILFALLFASPAGAVCAFPTVWPACTVQFPDGRNLEDKYGFFDQTICSDNVTPGTCDSGSNRWSISGIGLGIFSGGVRTDQFLNLDNDWLAIGDSGMTEVRVQSDDGWVFLDAGFTMSEEAAWPGDWENGYGSIWTKVGAPNTLFFHDDGGTDRQLGALQGDCTVQPCFDGSADGGTQISIYEANAGYEATFLIKDNQLTADATYMLYDNNQAVSTTNLRIPVMNNSGYRQVWQGEQSFTNTAEGTRISKILTNDIDPLSVSAVMIYGASTVPGHNFDSQGGTVLLNASFSATEKSVGTAMAPGFGEYYVKDNTPSAPGFIDDASPTGVNHVLAYLDDNVFTGIQEMLDDLILTNGVLFFKETTTPTPIADHGALYTKANNELFFQDGAGTEHLLHGDAFSNIWFHNPVHAGSPVTVTISAQDAFTKIDSFSVVGNEDDLANVVGSVSTNNLTLSTIAGGEYEISFHASISSIGAPRRMMVAAGFTLATPLDITDVTDDTVSPIVITITAHPLEDGDMVEIAGVLVNTAANGSFIVNNKTADTFQIVALDGSATTGNGDYDEGTPTGDVTIEYPGNLVVLRDVRHDTLGAIATTAVHVLSGDDVLALYVANLSSSDNLTVATVSFDTFRIGD